MIDVRSSKNTLKHANTGKLNAVLDYHFNHEIAKVVEDQINDLIYNPLPNMKGFADKDYQQKIKSLLPNITAQQIQLISKNIFGRASSITEKIKKAQWVSYQKKYQRELLAKYNNHDLHISFDNTVTLDTRFVSIQKVSTQNNKSKFGYYISFTLVGHRKTIHIPIMNTRHMRRLVSRGYELKTDTLILHKNGDIQLVYKQNVPKKKKGNKVGVDVGIIKTFVTSENKRSSHYSLMKKFNDKKYGSKGYKSLTRHIEHCIDYDVRHGLGIESIKTVVLEDLKSIKQGKRGGQLYHHWKPAYIVKRIELLAVEHGASVRRTIAAYTSQTCSVCGHVDEKSRNKGDFICTSSACGAILDADLNAAYNIALG